MFDMASILSRQPTQPNNPEALRPLEEGAAPDRFAKSAVKRGRVAKTC
jgi:hypothetical protein